MVGRGEQPVLHGKVGVPDRRHQAPVPAHRAPLDPGDEQVDRWDHDNELRRRFEEAERKKEAEAAEAAQKKAQAEKEANEKANESAGPEDSAPKSVDAPKRKAPKKK